MINKVAALTAGLLLVPAAASAAAWPPGGGPDYVPVPEGVIEHRAVEFTSTNSDGSPYRRREETWTSTRRQHSILVDPQTGKLLGEDATDGGSWRHFSPSINRLSIFKLDRPDRPATASARTEAATVKARVEAGELAVKGSTTYDGAAAIVLDNGAGDPYQGEFPTEYVVEPGSYRVLQTTTRLTGTLEKSNAPFVTTSTMRVVTLEDLPATASNAAKLRMKDPPGAEVRTSELVEDGAKAAGPKKKAKKKMKKKAKKKALRR